MTTYGPAAKVLAAAAAGSTVLVFAPVTLAILLPAVIGVALIMLGVAAAYRLPAVIGLLTVLTTMALAIEIPTLTDAEGVIRAATSVFAPAVALAWAALSCEPGEEGAVGVRSRPTAVLVAVGAIVLLIIPLFVFVVGVFLPTVSIRVSAMAEISVLLVAITATGMLLNRSDPARRTAPAGSVQEPAEDAE